MTPSIASGCPGHVELAGEDPGVTVGVVLPVVAATTALAVRMSRGALEADLRDSGLALARELAAATAQQFLRLASSHGYGRKDHSSVCAFLKPSSDEDPS